MPRMIFVNLPVKDLAAATRFYLALGCKKNEQFSDAQASSMVWSDTINFQLLVQDYFASFTPRQVTDAHKATEVLIALTCDKREEVDAICAAATAGGGKADVRSRMDLGFMYNRAFSDPDGHIFEAVWMNMEAMAEQAGKTA